MSFAERLEHLIETVHPAGRGPLTNAEIAAELENRGHKVTGSYISHLRRGSRGNRGVGAELVLTLADMFGVDPYYFYNDEVAATTDQQLDLIAAVRDAGVERIATRSMGLSTDGIDAIEGMIEHLRKVEGMRASRERERSDSDDDTEPSAE